MARELDSEMLRRLQENYGAMSDGELLKLAVEPEDLTEMAREVLRGEMTRRGLKAEAPVAPSRFNPDRAHVQAPRTQSSNEQPSVDPFGTLLAGPAWGAPEPSKVQQGSASLMVFYDAIELGRACDFLEEQEIGFEINDLSKPRSGLKPFERPVEMELVVSHADKLRAMAVLREKMGLFPLQEVEVADAPLDDGTLATLGDFGRRADAEEFAQKLEAANIWHRIVANEEGSVSGEDAFTLQVREVDLMRAGDVALPGA